MGDLATSFPIGTALAVLVAVLAIAGAVAIIVAYLVSNLRKETQAALKDTNDELNIQLGLRDTTIDNLRTEVADQNRTIEFQKERLATQDQRITDLNEAVTQRASVDEFRAEAHSMLNAISLKLGIVAP